MVEFHRPADWTLLTTSRGEPAIKVDALLPGTPVLLILDRLTEASGLLDEVARDDGLDETRNTLVQWGYRDGFRLSLIEFFKSVGQLSCPAA